MSAFRGAQVMDLLDGSDLAPAKTVEVTEGENSRTIPNPAYADWISRDQIVLSFLVRSPSREVHAHVLGLEHTAEVWAVLKDLFSS